MYQKWPNKIVPFVVSHDGPFGLGPQTQCNNIERVYSRAIAFSNRRCSVLLESLLPNHCYVQRAYLYVQASLLDPVLLPPSHVSTVLLLFCILSALGRARTYWGVGTWTCLVVVRVAGTHSAKPQTCVTGVITTVYSYPSLPGSGHYSDILDSVFPMETVSSADVTNSSSSIKQSSQATDCSSVDEASCVGDSISCSPSDLSAPEAPAGV